jgi:hypothetical protein
VLRNHAEIVLAHPDRETAKSAALHFRRSHTLADAAMCSSLSREDGARKPFPRRELPKAPLWSGRPRRPKAGSRLRTLREGGRLWVSRGAIHRLKLPPGGSRSRRSAGMGRPVRSDSASASTCPHLPRTTSWTFVAADETARIRNEQRCLAPCVGLAGSRKSANIHAGSAVIRGNPGQGERR